MNHKASQLRALAPLSLPTFSAPRPLQVPQHPNWRLRPGTHVLTATNYTFKDKNWVYLTHTNWHRGSTAWYKASARITKLVHLLRTFVRIPKIWENIIYTSIYGIWGSISYFPCIHSSYLNGLGVIKEKYKLDDKPVENLRIFQPNFLYSDRLRKLYMSSFSIEWH